MVTSVPLVRVVLAGCTKACRPRGPSWSRRSLGQMDLRAAAHRYRELVRAWAQGAW
jgi:hypothetical protein